MDRPSDQAVTGIEVLEDVTARSRCDEGFLHVKRLGRRNRYADGTTSRRVPGGRGGPPDPRRGGGAHLAARSGRDSRSSPGRRCAPRPTSAPGLPLPLPDPRGTSSSRSWWRACSSRTTAGEAGLLRRAAEEVLEEAGFRVSPDEPSPGSGGASSSPRASSPRRFTPPWWRSPGWPQETPDGDGSPLEDGATLRWWEASTHCSRPAARARSRTPRPRSASGASWSSAGQRTTLSARP